MSHSSVFSFEVPGHSTAREWAVYIIVAKKQDCSSYYYVGKVGDNRQGCNPMISRIGNHLSLNKIHSQLRNRLGDTTKYNFKVFYATFGKFDPATYLQDLARINELERRLNKLLQHDNRLVLNPYKGSGFISRAEKENRNAVVSASEM